MTMNYYGTRLARPVSKDIQAESQKTYGINFPFGKNNKKGYFAKESGNSLIKSNLKQLLGTFPGERVMLPNFGLDLRKYLFEPLDAITFSEIKQDILFVLGKYAPYVDVVGLRITENSKVNYTGIPGIIVELTVKLKEEEDVTIDVTVNVGG